MIFEKLLLEGLAGGLAIDIGSVVWGGRDVGLAHIPILKVKPFVKLLTDLGLQSAISRHLSAKVDPSTGQFRLDDGGISSVLDMAEIWFSKERLEEKSIQTLIGAPGERLGYPECCIRAYSGTEGFGSIYQRYVSDVGIRSWRLNRFASAFCECRLTLDYLPCSLACEPSAQVAVAYTSFLEAALGRSELDRRVRLNRMMYAVLGGQLVRFSDFGLDDRGGLVIDVSKIEKSEMRFDTDLEKAEIGLLRFDCNHDFIGRISSVSIKTIGRSWHLSAREL